MPDLDKAVATQIANIQSKTGKSLDQLYAWMRSTGLSKHGELRSAAKDGLGLGHGDANTLVTLFLRESGAAKAPAADPRTAAEEIYSGAKAALRPIHDRLISEIEKLGTFEIAPKKDYVSLRRQKQFATVGPATKTQVEVGLNARELDSGERLEALPAGRMCQYRVRLASPEEVDAQLLGWVRAAYEAAG